MELEQKLFKSFFYPFLIGVILSTLIVSLLLGLYTNSYYDKRAAQIAINAEINYTKMQINSANVILSSMLLKIQAAINEQILFYEKIANQIKDIEDISNLTLYDDSFKSVYDLTDEYCEAHSEKLDLMGYWYIANDSSSFDELKDKRTQKQIIAYSHIIHNLDSTLEAASDINSVYEYFAFYEETDLFFSFPVSYDYDDGNFYTAFVFYPNPYWCTNDEGVMYNIYYVKCRDFYVNIQKARSNTFDLNFFKGQNRTLFVTNFYRQLGQDGNDFIFTMCIRFLDPISKGNAYVCCDVNQNDLNFAFDELNSKILGYFFLSAVGFNGVYYFPQGNDEPKTSTDNIYKWEKEFFLEEKSDFFKDIQKILTSNYISQVGINIYNEVL